MEFNGKLMEIFGKSDGDTSLVFRGVQKSGKIPQPIVITMRGLLTEQALGSLKPNEKSEVKYKMNVRYLKASVNKDELLEIDMVNMFAHVGKVNLLVDTLVLLGA